MTEQEKLSSMDRFEKELLVPWLIKRGPILSKFIVAAYMTGDRVELEKSVDELWGHV